MYDTYAYYIVYAPAVAYSYFSFSQHGALARCMVRPGGLSRGPLSTLCEVSKNDMIVNLSSHFVHTSVLHMQVLQVLNHRSLYAECRHCRLL